MSGAPNTTTPVPVVDAYHRKSYAYTTVNSMSVVEYIGIAAPGTLKSDKGWSITKFVYNADAQVIDQLWADGTDDFAKVWDNRTGYTYSNS